MQNSISRKDRCCVRSTSGSWMLFNWEKRCSTAAMLSLYNYQSAIVYTTEHLIPVDFPPEFQQTSIECPLLTCSQRSEHVLWDISNPRHCSLVGSGNRELGQLVAAPNMVHVSCVPVGSSGTCSSSNPQMALPLNSTLARSRCARERDA